MDQRIFDQLDRLEAGAREETRPSRHAYEDNSAESSGYDGYEPVYGGAGGYQDDGRYVGDMFADQERHFIRQPDHCYDDGLGVSEQQPPFVTDPLANAPRDAGNPFYGLAMNQPSFRSQGLDLSRFDMSHDQPHESSSSPFAQPGHSTSAFRTSQRQPRPFDYPKQTRPSLQRDAIPEADEYQRYEPLGVEDLQAEEQDQHAHQYVLAEQFQPSYRAPAQSLQAKPPTSKTPVVQGISLVSTRDLPDRFRSVFPYPLFNAIQSKSFETIYNSNDNFVLSAPTGSGKTVVLELAICRLVTSFASGSYKIVYQAPTKSLCSERQRDWEAKFASLDLKCAELTGDTDAAQLRNVQHASIIITTPEKWDSVTRKWKDHEKLMQMVKLFLIDEVHILKEDRGATLEAVVSRMKSVGSNVRFVALSATVPNSDDIATWLGKDPMNAHLPAVRERFGEEFRPVRLQKHVRGYQSNSNDFAFEKTLDAKLPEVIAKWSQRKPIMIFCFTRKACADTAKLLMNWWATKEPRERYWSAPRKRIVVADKDLRDTVSSGVAFHHAGLSAQDRAAIEQGYLEGDINVICCTSTLAVGVNLPCHMVIIKNTVTYQGNFGGCKEYSDLEIMQMLGRAGRPQFDNSAVAVIMTRTYLTTHYENMVTGQEILESRLHENLIDHLNAEIGLGTVTGASSAKRWLSGTFLYVRLKENPEHYKIDGNIPSRNLEESLETFIQKAIASLQQHDLVSGTPKLRCTEFGDAMARYYLQFDTMKGFLYLAPKAKISEILSAISNAAEFKDIRFRAGEKNMYKSLNKNGSIKFPIPADLNSPAHKVSLIIQAVLGAIDLPTDDQKHQWEFQTSKATIFQHAQRLVRCIVDCQLYIEDSIATRNALMLARSLGAQVWDDSPLHMKQLEGIGIVSVRKLVATGISSVEDLELTESHRIEQALSRNPPYGLQIQGKAKAFPKLRISIKMMGEPEIKKGEHVTVRIKAEIGFLNEKIPEMFQRRAVYVCLLAETSNGHKIHFVRISAKKLNKGQDVLFSANLTSASQSIRAYVMCDEIAGSMRHVVLNPKVPAIAFPLQKAIADTEDMGVTEMNNVSPTATMNSKKRQALQTAAQRASQDNNEFGDGGLDDADLAGVEVDEFVNISDLEGDGERSGQPPKKKQKAAPQTTESDDWEPWQLSNGKWACNHACKDKSSCKHLCCREGLDKKPKPPKQKESKNNTESGPHPKQTQLSMNTTKKQSSIAPAKTSTMKPEPKLQNKTVGSKEAHDLNRLHDSVPTKTNNVPRLGLGRNDNGAGRGMPASAHSDLCFLKKTQNTAETGTSDYGMDAFDSNDLPEIYDIMGTQPASRMSPPHDNEDSLFDLGFLDNMDAGTQFMDASKDDVVDSNEDGHGLHERGYNIDRIESENNPERTNASNPTAVVHSKKHSTAGSSRSKPLFIGHSTGDSHFNELPIAHGPMQKVGGEAKHTSTFFDQARPARPGRQRSVNPTTEAALDSNKEGDAAAITPQNTIASSVEKGDEEAKSEDSVMNLVKGLLGTKDFNYID